MVNERVIYGHGKRYQVLLEDGRYRLVDSQNADYEKASISEKAWTVDCEAIFCQYADKWNNGVYVES